MHSTVGDLYLRPNALHCWGSLSVGDLYLRPNALHCWGSLFTALMHSTVGDLLP